MFKKIISISLMFILVFVGTNKTIAAQEPEKETITVYSTETEEWNNLLSGKMGRAENRIGDVLDYTGGYSGLSFLNYQLLFTTADYDLMDFKVYITSFSDNKKTREYEYDNGVRWLDKKNNNEYYIVPRDYPQNNKGAIEAINFPPNNDNYKQIIVKTEEEAQALTNIHYKVNVGDTVLEITLGDLLSNSYTHFHMASFMGLTRSGSWTFSDFYMSTVFRATYEKEIEPSKGADIYVNYIDEDNNHLHPHKTLSGNIGESFTTEKEEIPEYTFKHIHGEPDGVFSDIQQEITYVYSKSIKEITVSNTPVNDDIAITPEVINIRPTPESGVTKPPHIEKLVKPTLNPVETIVNSVEIVSKTNTESDVKKTPVDTLPNAGVTNKQKFLGLLLLSAGVLLYNTKRIKRNKNTK
ncbi:MucBP domain-containing protein [Erysipelothrix rhusiopathiae]|nr:MucBP domain-containing protein [Erysipelothrix rhusiopathiae]